MNQDINVRVELVSLGGQIISLWEDVHSVEGHIELALPSVSSGYYLVKIMTAKGLMLSESLIIR